MPTTRTRTTERICPNCKGRGVTLSVNVPKLVGVVCGTLVILFAAVIPQYQLLTLGWARAIFLLLACGLPAYALSTILKKQPCIACAGKGRVTQTTTEVSEGYSSYVSLSGAVTHLNLARDYWKIKTDYGSDATIESKMQETWQKAGEAYKAAMKDLAARQ